MRRARASMSEPRPLFGSRTMASASWTKLSGPGGDVGEVADPPPLRGVARLELAGSRGPSGPAQPGSATVGDHALCPRTVLPRSPVERIRRSTEASSASARALAPELPADLAPLARARPAEFSARTEEPSRGAARRPRRARPDASGRIASARLHGRDTSTGPSAGAGRSSSTLIGSHGDRLTNAIMSWFGGRAPPDLKTRGSLSAGSSSA